MNHSADIPAPHNGPACPLAIIGIGCLFPKAADKTAYWANIKQRVDAISEVPETHWRLADYYDADPKAPDKTYGRRGGFLDAIDFNPLEFSIQPNILEAIDSSQLLGLVAAREALRDAGYDPAGDFARERVSVLLGVTGALEMVIPLGARLGHPQWRRALLDAGVPAAVADEVIERIAAAYVPWQENSFPGLLGNVVAGRISKQFDLGGSNSVVDAACGSSLSAVHMAAMELACHRADMVITGGIDTFNDIFMYSCFSKTPALSPSNRVCPFDASSDGTLIGEGLGLVVLKRLADAERDGDAIYAVIRGVGSASDGKGGAIYEPSAKGQVRTLRDAHAQAGVTPRSIGLIEAHGTGTRVGDATEIRALREVFGDSDGRPWCALGSVKSQIGHTKAAAGAAGLIKAALALRWRVLPPTLNVQEPQAVIGEGNSPFYVNTELRPWLHSGPTPRRAGVSAFGFGGSNFHCVLEEYDQNPPACDWAGAPQILAFSAADDNALRQQLSACRAQLANGDAGALRRFAARSRAAYAAEAAARLLCVVEQPDQLASQLDAAERLIAATAEVAGTPTGVWYSRGTRPAPQLAVLFPGQGAQYPFMLRDLACHAPELLDQLQLADATLGGAEAEPLSARLYPHSCYSTADQAAAAQQLQATAVAQPAIGCVSLGAWHYLQRFGLQAQGFAGHSYGELTALCAAGSYSAAELYRLSQLRGQLMAGTAGDDRGTMLAVTAPLEQIDALVREEALDLVLANRNTPNQGVLSGRRSEIERAASLCRQRGLRATPLEVAAAFHSPLVAEASVPFRAALDETVLLPPTLPVYANSTATLYPAGPTAEGDEVRDLLAQQIARPVEFVRQIQRMADDGFNLFVEVGPGARLTGMVGKILADRPVPAIALDSSAGKRHGLVDVARLLAQLCALGVPLQLQSWDAEFAAAAVVAAEPAPPRLTVRLCGANYRREQTPRPPSDRQLVDARSLPQVQAAPAPAASAAPAAQPAPQHDNLLLLQRMQEDTARLHEQFLAGQASALQALQALLGLQAPAATPPASPATVTQPAISPAPCGAPAAPLATAPPPPAAASAPPSLPAAPAATLATTAAAGALEQALLAVVADKTGYPVDMLELDMRLDADLGIDSIKRVEILSALQEQLPQLPAVAPDELGRLETLRQIVDSLSSSLPAAALATTATAGTAASAPTLAAGALEQALLTVVADKTGYPVDMLELDMRLDADLGIDSIKRVEILSALQEQLPQLPAVAPDELGRLETLRQIVDSLSSNLPAAPAAALTTTAAAPTLAAGALEQALLTVVADKTGYPVDMLELDMRLDADLGIDSIKRVEILSALQEQLPQLPAVAPDELGRLETLRQIVDSLSSSLPAIPAAALASTATASTAASTPTLAAGALEQALLTVVADKTGYPVDMLELDMRLDADLGIDSIKRVEILSALQEQLPQLPAVAPDELGRLETLRQIVSALAPAALTTDSTRQGQALPLSSCATPASCRCASKGSCADPATCHCTSSTAGAAELAQAGLHRQRIRLVPLPAAPPRPLINDAPFWIVDDCSPLSTALAEALRQQGLVAEIVGPQQHNPPARLAGLLIPAPAVGSDSPFLQQAFELLQRCATALQNAASGGRKALFVTLARLDGRFGFDPAGMPLADPLSGGLAGLSKTAGHEWPNVCCQAYDLAAELPLAQQVEALVTQLQQQGPAEIGLTAAGPVTLQLETTPLPQPAQPLRFSSDEVIIVSGGARGVTAEVACQLAAAGQPTLLLLGRSPLPQAEDAELAAASDEAAIKRLLLARTPDKPNPRALQQACQQVLAARELRANLARMTASGARVLYRALDIRDEAAVAAAVAEARACGRIRGLIHGAGVLADKRIEDKTAEQFAAVYSTKVAGLLALLQATADDALDFIALFSSSTGRFGRTGQCDYAVANEVLNKSAQAIARQRPDCRVLALNWGPWDGGMVTPALKQLFAGEGIEVIDLRQGAAYLLAELADSRRNEVELVLLGGGPPAASAGGDHTGPADTATSEAPTAPLLAQPLYELTVASRRMAVLRDHVLAGRAVLPTALHLEWLAQAALHSQPGLQLLAIDNLCICSGLKLAADDSAQLQLRGGSPAQTAEGLRLPLQLCDAASGQLYSRAEALLADRLAAAPEPLAALALDPASGGDAARYYRNGQLFHGPLLQGLRQIIGSSASGIEALCQTAPAPANWLDAPLRSSWLTEPLLVDGAFQLLILWTQAQHGRACLPAAIGRYRSFVEEFPAGLGRLRCRIDRLQGNQLNATIDLLDEAGQRVLARLEQVQATLAELTAAFAANRLQA